MISFKKIVLSWLLVGTLDMTAACVDYYLSTGKDPVLVPKYISSAILGTPAFTGGAGVVATGFLLHYTVALCFTLFFFFVWTRGQLFSRHWILSGFLYGLSIWCVMNLLVVPMTKAPATPIHQMVLDKAGKSALILVFMIGLPLAFIARSRKAGNSVTG